MAIWVRTVMMSVAAAVLLTGRAGAQTQSALPAIAQTHGDEITADIRYTSYGVPHIKSDTFEGLGFGLGYAFTAENVCLMAEQFVTLRGERTKFFGRDGFFHDRFAEALGEQIGNVDSDFFHKLIYSDVAAFQKSGPGPQARSLVAGYVAGYNKYIAENGDRLPDACKGKDWVRPIDESDAYRRLLQSQLLGGYGVFVKSIADAMEIDGEAGEKHATHIEAKEFLRVAEAFRSNAGIGSNAAAFGREMTPDGRGMLLGNPHFPWSGPERLYQMHLTIPGRYDIMGAALYGVPLPQIGFNSNIAWSLTWSTDIRFLVRRLSVDKNDPHQYFVDGKSNALTATPLSVEVLNSDGTISIEHRTAYASKYGPLLGGRYFAGAKNEAYAITDLNYDNNKVLQAYFEITDASSVKEIDESQNRLGALPYSNVTAVDANGTAYYSNKSVAANVPDAQLKRCLSGKLAKSYKDNFGVVILDGADSSCDPKNDPEAVRPGILAAPKKPFIFRPDYAEQSNDSHWIVNADPSSYLEGFDFVVGPERTPRGERLRAALSFIEDRRAGRDGLDGNRMTPELMRNIFYRSRLIEAELMKDDLVADCERSPTMRISWTLEWVDVSKACAVLKAWDASQSADAVGAHIFREFYNNLLGPSRAVRPEVWKTKFNADQPLATPRGLKPSRLTRSALAKAVKFLNENGVPLDARFGDIQFVTRNGEKLPISGGRGFHRIQMTFKKGVGYTDPVVTGDSYIQAVSLGADGPTGYVINSYSQSTNPASPHSYDQTRLYSQEKWPQIRFSDEEIESDPAFRSVHISKGMTASHGGDR